MDEKKLRKFLTKTEKEGILSLYGKGYAWLKSDFLPYLELGDDLLPDDGELLADCWYLVGDVFDFNAAPLKAVEYYKKAIACDEEIQGAYREIATMYELVGRYTEALEYLNVAIEKVPDDEMMLEDKAAIEDSINYTTEPFLTEDNLAWKLNEKLAEDGFDAVIKTVSEIEKPEVDVLQCLARAYGAKDNQEEYLKTWENIKASNSSIVLDHGDWFYMPLAVYDGKEIWQLIKSMAARIEEATFVYFDSLDEHYADALTDVERVSLICDFQIYKATSNHAAIKDLGAKYPNWEEVSAV